MTKPIRPGHLPLGLAVLTATLLAAPAAAQDVAFTGVRLFDGERVREGVTVLVREGVVQAVGTDVVVPAGVETVEGAGGTLMPGLIDAHTHAQTRGHLETALRFGVTTELDHFGNPDFLRRMRAEQEAGSAPDRADLFGAGIVATAPGGHGTQYDMEIPTLTTPEEADAFVAARVAEGSDWLKIIRTNPAGRRPTLDLETIGALIAAAHAHGIMAVVHVSTVDDALAVVAMGADGVVHTADDRMPEPDFGARFAETGAFAVPTLTVLWGWATGAEGTAQMNDPLLGPRLDAQQEASLADAVPVDEDGELRVAASAATVRLMNEAGAPVLAGSDAPNPHTAHGATMHRELENLVEAGLTPVEALVAATSAAADAFGLADRGRVAPGLRADLLLVEGDPTTDVRATRRVLGVWKGGTPVEVQGRQGAPDEEADNGSSPGMVETR